jgi:Arc/MetJ-type ribon-helix-helix transcriptional regulator
VSKTVRTTVTLSEELLRATDRAVREGEAGSRNEFFGRALRHELDALERASIDAAFGSMADDPLYAAEAEELDQGFEGASWEALRAAEGSPPGSGEKGG